MKYFWISVIAITIASCGTGEEAESNKDASSAQNNKPISEEEAPVDILEAPSMDEEWEEVEEDSADIEVYEPTELSKQFKHPIDDCLQSNKVESLIIPPGKDDDEYAEFASIPTQAFNELNKEEKLVYCLKYPEWFDQVCAESMPYDPERLKTELPWDNSGRSMSTRQDEFIKNNASFVLAKITDCIGTSDEINDDYLRLFGWLHYTDYIPDLLEKYKNSHNTYYLTLCIVLMQNDEYAPYYDWIKTTPFNEPNFDVMMTGIELTEEIESSLIALVQDYYASINQNTGA